VGSVECPDPEALARLATADGDPAERAALADHAASCESCHAAVSALLGTSPALMETAAAADGSRHAMAAAGTDRIDRYVVRGRLGAGGMGVVYVAHDPELDRDVAIKVLRRGAAASRLRREAQALARLSHPNVVAVYDVGDHDGQVFVAMALVDGQNLRQWLSEPRTTTEILRVLAQAARGIIAAHAAGLIHRDLKPDNIFVAKDGTALVGDFGLARDISDDADDSHEQQLHRISAASTQLTMTGMVLGTPAYMAPEQAEGSATDRSDQFSFCVTAYEALFGTRPFVAGSLEKILERAKEGKLEPPKVERDVPVAVTRAITRGLAWNPDDRFASMTELLAVLEPRPRRWPWLVAAAGAVAAGIAGTIAVTHATKPNLERECSAAAAKISSSWNSSVRDGMRATLVKRGLTDVAADELVTRLESWATRWSRVRREVCLGGGAGAEAKAREACFETRKKTFDDTLATVPDTAARSLMDGWRFVSMLPAPESCRHARAQEVDPFKVDTLDHTLTLASMSLDRADRVDAEQKLTAALPDAESTEDPALRARAYAELGRLRCLQGRVGEGKSLVATATTLAAKLAADESDRELDEITLGHADCLAADEHFAEVVPLLLQQLERLRRRYGPESPFEALLYVRLVEAYRATGDMKSAADALRQGGRIQQKYFGGGAYGAEEAATDEAVTRGDLDGAIEHMTRAVALSPNEMGRVTGLSALAVYYEMAANWTVAAEIHGEVVEAAGNQPVFAEYRADSLVSRGLSLMYLGNLDAAARDLDAGIEAAKAGQDSERVLAARIGRDQIWVARGEYARAVRDLRDLIPEAAHEPKMTSFRLGTAELAFAKALWETGDRDGARTHGREAERLIAAGVDEAKREAIAGPKFIAFRQGILDAAMKWRDEHR
jgi:tetratricopeptide (TPR) repeat protein/predicted Ser/Thr protein kinase